MTRFAPLSTSYLGFDSLFDQLESMLSLAPQMQGYPPLNLYRNEDSGYTIELAVAGFKKSDIKIEHDKARGWLTISGDTSARTEVPVEEPSEQPVSATKLSSRSDETKVTVRNERATIKQGIANRKFTKTFTIADNLDVESAELADGLLTLHLKAEDKPENKPLQIELK